MTTEQPILRARSVPDSIRYSARELIKWAGDDMTFAGFAIALNLTADRAEAELAEAAEKVRICEAQLARLDAENTRLRKENDDLTVGLGIADGPRRQINDVLDVAPDLTAALTRHEVTA